MRSFARTVQYLAITRSTFSHQGSSLNVVDTLNLPAKTKVDTCQRLRLTYEKGEPVKFISHQDEFRLWERTLRRANLPLLYKEGFNPQPSIQFASPLGVGITGVREPVDITLSASVPLADIAQRIREKLPPGIHLHTIEEVPLKTPALYNLLIGADYRILLYAEPGEIAADLLPQRIEALLAQTEIVRERERKGEKYLYNLRPLILELRYAGYDPTSEEYRIFLRVQQREGATGRPDEVVAALGLDDFARTLRRERLFRSDLVEDAATFAAYRVISQAEIMRSQTPRRKAKWRNQRQAPTAVQPASGRSISERAGDEFG